MLTTSGMMNGGPRAGVPPELGRRPLHTLVFVGYPVEGTIGNKIQKGVKELTLSERGRPGRSRCA